MAPTAHSIGYAGAGDYAMLTDGALRKRKEHQVVPFVYAGAAILSPTIFKDAPARRILADANVRRCQRAGPAVSGCASKASGCMSARRTPSHAAEECAARAASPVAIQQTPFSTRPHAMMMPIANRDLHARFQRSRPRRRFCRTVIDALVDGKLVEGFRRARESRALGRRHALSADAARRPLARECFSTC